MRKQTMYLLVTTFLLTVLVGCVKCDTEEDECREDGPDRCCFEKNFCNWRHRNWTINHNYGNYTYLRFDRLSGSLKSRMACPTGENWHCLTFEYYLGWNTLNEIALSLRIFHETSDVYQYVLAKGQNHGGWYTAAIPMQLLHPFKLIFKARRIDSTAIKLKNIYYYKQPCPGDHTLPGMVPEIASPKPTSTLKTETEMNTSREIMKTTTGTLPDITHASADTTGSVSTPANVPTAAKSKTPPGESANKSATIVGVVVAVVVVIGVGFLVLVLYRRGQLHFWKTLFKDRKPKENLHVHASHNAAYNVDISDPDIAHGIKMNLPDPNYDYHRLNTGIVTQPLEDYYSVIKDPEADFPAQGPPVPQYSTVNKTRKAGHGNISKGPHSSDDNPYEIEDDTVDFASKQPSRRNDHNDLKICISEKLGGSASASPANSEYNLLGSAGKGTAVTRDNAAGLHHCLEEDPETQGQPDGTGLYHHLEDDPEAKGALDRTGQYHCLEEDPETHGPQYGTPLYHYMDEDPEIQQRQNGTGEYHCLEEDPETQGSIEGTEVYHCLEEDPETQGPQNGTKACILVQDPTITTGCQTASVYDVPKGERNNKTPERFYVSDAAKDLTSATSDGQAGEYNSLNFSGKNSAPERRDGDSGKVYSHLNEGDEDAYSEVDREKRREIIDSDYSHIK